MPHYLTQKYPFLFSKTRQCELGQCGLRYSRCICLDAESFKCWVNNCKHDKEFKSMIALKKHLKDTHHRMLCEICVDNRALILSEQKLFRPDEQKSHIWNGDFDEENNLIFLHPYCEFCDRHFYNEEEFVKHLRDHYTCDQCSDVSTIH